MVLTLELPDKIAEQLRLDGPQAQRRALVALAVDGYRSGNLSRGQVSEVLGLSFYETEALLKEHECGLGLTADDYKREGAEARALLGW